MNVKARVIADQTYKGGAEMSFAELANYFATDGNAFDFQIVGNITQFNYTLISELEKAPVVKVVHDVWPHGDRDLRAWILKNAALLVFKSPEQYEYMRWRHNITAPHAFIPGPIDVARFKRARSVNRKGMAWVGRLEAHKGLSYAIAYAIEQGEELNVYGDGPLRDDLHQFGDHVCYHGVIPYDEMPAMLGSTKTLVHLPVAYDACPRVVLEAHAAGCEIVTNNMQGATWWIDNKPDAIATAKQDFRKAVIDAL